MGLWEVFANAPAFIAAAGIAALLSVALAFRVYQAAFARQNRRGLGSGENNRWNRLIRTDVPAFPEHQRYALEHSW